MNTLTNAVVTITGFLAITNMICKWRNVKELFRVEMNVWYNVENLMLVISLILIIVNCL